MIAQALTESFLIASYAQMSFRKQGKNWQKKLLQREQKMFANENCSKLNRKSLKSIKKVAKFKLLPYVCFFAFHGLVLNVVVL